MHSRVHGGTLFNVTPQGDGTEATAPFVIRKRSRTTVGYSTTRLLGVKKGMGRFRRNIGRVSWSLHKKYGFEIQDYMVMEEGCLSIMAI